MQMKKNYVIFDPYYTNREGAWYFAPDEGEFCQGKACYGFGSVKYFDGSVYIGELYYDGETFNKIGYGQQNFIRSRIADLDRRSGLCKNVYVGSFDYRKTDWIYGNGVMYYMDEQNKPLCFAKGFFEGVQKVGEYQGTFDYDLLLKGYTGDMEIDREDTDAAGKWLGKQVAPWKDKSPDVLFVGDSYFELGDHDDYAGKHLFGKVFPSTYVNIGIGGSRFCDWIDWIDSVENIAAPQKIVVNLGFNDIHCNMAADNVFADYKTLLGKLRGFFPQRRCIS